MIEILGLPVPPPDNHLYINLRYRGGRTKGPIYRSYEAEFNQYCWLHREELKSKCDILNLWPSKELKIEINFKFFWSKLYCKDKSIKKMDVSNRLKCFLDLLSKALQFDDSKFFEVHCQKSIGIDEGVDVKISPKKVLNEATLLQK